MQQQPKERQLVEQTWPGRVGDLAQRGAQGNASVSWLPRVALPGRICFASTDRGGRSNPAKGVPVVPGTDRPTQEGTEE